MRKIVFLLLLIGGLVAGILAVSASNGLSLKDVISKTLAGRVAEPTPPVSTEEQGGVLGEAVEDSSPTPSSRLNFGSIGSQVSSVVGPIVQTVGSVLGTVVEETAKAVTGNDQKIEIDKAIEEAKKNAANVPGEVFDKAKYEYCKQVISDYETREQ